MASARPGIRRTGQGGIGAKTRAALSFIPVMACLCAAPMADAGIFGALDNLANAAQAAGVNVPSSAYAVGSVANDIHQAGESMSTPPPARASGPACPPGYRCVPSGTAPSSAMAAATPPVDPVPTYRTARDPVGQTLAASPRIWTVAALEAPRIPVILHPRKALAGDAAPIPGTGDFFPISERLWRLVRTDSVSFFMGTGDEQANLFQRRETGHVPRIFVFLSPNCTLSWDFWRQAQPYLRKGTLDLQAVVVGNSNAMGQAENILSSRVPGVQGAGAGEMAAMQLASDFQRFDYRTEMGGVRPIRNSGAERLARRNMNLLTLLAERAVPEGDAARGMINAVTPTMVMRIHGKPYVYVARQNFSGGGASYDALLGGMEGE